MRSCTSTISDSRHSRAPYSASTFRSVCCFLSITLFLLRVNKEARKVALKAYTLLYDVPDGSPKIHFNLDVDILWIPRDDGLSSLNALRPDILKRIKYLAYGGEGIHPAFHEFTWAFLYKVIQMEVEELYILFGEEDIINEHDLTFLGPKHSAFDARLLRGDEYATCWAFGKSFGEESSQIRRSKSYSTPYLTLSSLLER